MLQKHKAPKPLVFWHDAQAQIRGRVFTSVDEWRSAAAVPALSVFRGVEPAELAQLAIDVGDVVLVLDELDMATGGNKSWPRGSDSVRRIVHYGRHLRVTLLGGFRRTQNIPEDALSQADHVFLFRHEEDAARDLDAIEDRFGERFRVAAAALEPGQFVVVK